MPAGLSFCPVTGRSTTVTDPEHASARLAFTEYARPGIVTRSYHSATTVRGVTDPAHALALEAFTKNAWSGIVG
jgi:hypothetical protein